MQQDKIPQISLSGRWDANDYDERKVNFYNKYGARLIAEYKQVLQEDDEKQDTVRTLHVRHLISRVEKPTLTLT